MSVSLHPSPDADPNRKRVVVIGAGLAGLTTADRLLSSSSSSSSTGPSPSVVVLESSSRVGGRNASCFLQTVPDTAIDAGGQWLGAKHQPLENLANELGIPSLPQFNTGRRVVQLGVDVRTYRGLIPNLSWGVLIDAQIAILIVKVLQLLIWLFPASRCCGCLHRRLDRSNMESLSHSVMWSQGGKALLRIIIRAFLGLEPSQVSVLAFAREINAGGSVETMSETGSGNLQMATFQGGAQQLSARLADRVLSKGGHFVFDSRVVSVSRGTVTATSATGSSSSSSSAAVATTKPILVRCENGSTFEADHVIVCCPAPLVNKQVTFVPSLSANRSAFMQRAAMGSIIKSIIVYPRAFWRDAGFSGEAICDVDSDPARGPCFNLFDGSVPVGSKPADNNTALLPAEKRMSSPSSLYLDPQVQAWIEAGRPSTSPAVGGVIMAPEVRLIEGRLVPILVAFINGAMAAEHSKRVSFEDRRKAVCRQIGNWFGNAEEASRPLEYIEQDWAAYPHTLGCPVASYGAGVLEAFGHHRELSEAEWPEQLSSSSSSSNDQASLKQQQPVIVVHRLHFAGTETSEVDTGFMSGAIRSGIRAAAEVEADLRAEQASGKVAAHYSHATFTLSSSRPAAVVVAVGSSSSSSSASVSVSEGGAADLGAPLLSASSSSSSSSSSS